MKAIQFRNPLAFLKAGQPGLNELNAILSLFPQPAVLVDALTDSVLNGNSGAVQLTAYTHLELQHTPFSKIFPEFEYKPASAGIDEPIPTRILLRSGLEEQVVAQSQALDPQSRWYAVLFEPLARQRQRMHSNHRLHNHMLVLQKLATALQISKANEIGATFLEVAQLMSGASTVALYRVDPGEPLLIKVNQLGEELPLPDTVVAAEIGRTGKPQLWAKGRRIRSGLQRFARTNNFSYLASAGIGEEPALFGLILAADFDGIPDDNLLTIMEVLASLLSSLYQHEVLTGQLQKINQLQTSRLKTLEAIQENVQDCVILTNREFKVQSMNPSAELTLGYATHEIRGQSIENILIGADNLDASLNLALEGISTPSLGNHLLHRRDGRPFPAYIQVTPIIENSQVCAILVILRDQSEHQQIKLRTQQLEQRALLGEVTAIFAHEVRNPVNNIGMALQLMEMKLPPDDPNREMVEHMKQDTDRLAHLMDSVLTFSRSTETKLGPMDLKVFLDQLVSRWRPRLYRANVNSELHIPPEIPRINGNEKSLEQVFTNLFTNALRAMAETGGTLSVRVKLLPQIGSSRHLQVDVSDTGIGIPPENLDTIFNPFFTTDPQGTGLGLAITQRIITAHKGSITVDSFPGGGTVFHIELPIIHSSTT
jgi:two-component system sensor histidine kinase AtoS